MPEDHKGQPWWNDGDKVSGLAATIFILGVAIIFLAFCIRVAWAIIT